MIVDKYKYAQYKFNCEGEEIRKKYSRKYLARDDLLKIARETFAGCLQGAHRAFSN